MKASFIQQPRSLIVSGMPNAALARVRVRRSLQITSMEPTPELQIHSFRFSLCHVIYQLL